MAFFLQFKQYVFGLHFTSKIISIFVKTTKKHGYWWNIYLHETTFHRPLIKGGYNISIGSVTGELTETALTVYKFANWLTETNI